LRGYSTATKKTPCERLEERPIHVGVHLPATPFLVTSATGWTCEQPFSRRSRENLLMNAPHPGVVEETLPSPRSTPQETLHRWRNPLGMVGEWASPWPHPGIGRGTHKEPHPSSTWRRCPVEFRSPVADTLHLGITVGDFLAACGKPHASRVTIGRGRDVRVVLEASRTPEVGASPSSSPSAKQRACFLWVMVQCRAESCGEVQDLSGPMLRGVFLCWRRDSPAPWNPQTPDTASRPGLRVKGCVYVRLPTPFNLLPTSRPWRHSERRIRRVASLGCTCTPPGPTSPDKLDAWWRAARKPQAGKSVPIRKGWAHCPSTRECLVVCVKASLRSHVEAPPHLRD